MITGVDHCGGIWYPGCPQSPASVCWMTQRAFSTSLVFFIQWLGEDFQVRKHLWVLAVLGKPLHCKEPVCPFAASWPLSGYTFQSHSWEFPVSPLGWGSVEILSATVGDVDHGWRRAGKAVAYCISPDLHSHIWGAKLESQWLFLINCNKFYVSRGLWVKP